MQHAQSKRWRLALAGMVTLALVAGCNDDDSNDDPAGVTLAGRAVLPAATFADGPVT